jgi:hypothetical protein
MTTYRKNPPPVYRKGVKLPKYPKPPDFKPDLLFPKDWHAPKLAGKLRCQAWAVTSGSQCNSAPVRGRLHCRKHGGKTPLGKAAGSYKTGRYSKNLPKRMLSSFEAALKDPELLDMRDDIALLKAHLDDLLAHVDTGEPGHFLQEARDALSRLESAMQEKDVPQTIATLAELGEIIDRAIADHALWEEILRTLKKVELTRERELNRQVMMNQFLTEDRALLLFSRVAEIIKENVHDKATLQRISDELAYLLVPPDEQLPQTAEDRNEESQGSVASS